MPEDRELYLAQLRFYTFLAWAYLGQLHRLRSAASATEKQPDVYKCSRATECTEESNAKDSDEDSEDSVEEDDDEDDEEEEEELLHDREVHY